MVKQEKYITDYKITSHSASKTTLQSNYRTGGIFALCPLLLGKLARIS